MWCLRPLCAQSAAFTTVLSSQDPGSEAFQTTKPTMCQAEMEESRPAGLRTWRAPRSAKYAAFGNISRWRSPLHRPTADRPSKIFTAQAHSKPTCSKVRLRSHSHLSTRMKRAMRCGVAVTSSTFAASTCRADLHVACFNRDLHWMCNESLL